jgi:hypothetical protein
MQSINVIGRLDLSSRIIGDLGLDDEDVGADLTRSHGATEVTKALIAYIYGQSRAHTERLKGHTHK